MIRALGVTTLQVKIFLCGYSQGEPDTFEALQKLRSAHIGFLI